jgi:hypothetical protein
VTTTGVSFLLHLSFSFFFLFRDIKAATAGILRQLGHTFCQSSNLFKCPGSPCEERGGQPMDQDPFYEFGGKGWGNAITVNIVVRGTATGISPCVLESTCCPCRSRKCFIRAHTLLTCQLAEASSWEFCWSDAVDLHPLRNCPGHGFSMFNLQQTVHRIFKQLSSSSQSRI